MKKLIDKIRKWLICRLGGVTLELHNDLIDREMLRNVYLCEKNKWLNAEIKNYRIAVREICRRSDHSFYNWCCSECHTAAERPLFCSGKGWCRGFTPIPRLQEEDV